MNSHLELGWDDVGIRRPANQAYGNDQRYRNAPHQCARSPGDGEDSDAWQVKVIHPIHQNVARLAWHLQRRDHVATSYSLLALDAVGRLARKPATRCCYIDPCR